MNSDSLKFHIAQVDAVIESCRKKFRSERKQVIYSNYLNLFNEIKKSNYTNFNKPQLTDCKILLDIIYRQIEFLDYKYLADIPFQLISCLEVALEDWLDSPSNFPIVFSSNSKELSDYYYHGLGESDVNAINSACKSLKFNAKIKHGLIPISQPRFFTQDYLSSIPVYHELGHFIDRNFGVVTQALRTINKSLLKYPKLDINDDEEEEIIENYLCEHFADLFAAQYLKETFIHKLEYLLSASPKDKDFPRHPSFNKRISVIYTFLNNSGPKEDFEIIEKLNTALKLKTKIKSEEKELLVRQIPLTKNPFNNSIKKTGLSSKLEVHTLFSEGWTRFHNPNYLSDYNENPVEKLSQINQIIKNTLDLTIPRPKYFDLSTILPRRWLY